LLEPSGHLDRFGERKITGSMFSELSLSRSKVDDLRLTGEVSARGEDVRVMSGGWIDWKGGSGLGECGRHTILTILQVRKVL